MTRDGQAADMLRGRGYAVTGDGKPRTWTVELPAGLELLSMNKDYHWAARRRIARGIRTAAWVCAKRARIPHLERARIVVEWQPPPKARRRDYDNVCGPSGKHGIDGIVDAGVLTDDAPPFVAGLSYDLGEPFPRGRLVIHLTEVADGA